MRCFDLFLLTLLLFIKFDNGSGDIPTKNITAASSLPCKLIYVIILLLLSSYVTIVLSEIYDVTTMFCIS